MTDTRKLIEFFREQVDNCLSHLRTISSEMMLEERKAEIRSQVSEKTIGHDSVESHVAELDHPVAA